MRVTNNTIINTVLKNLNNNSEKLDELNEQVSSGKKFEKPSDDPASYIKSMQLNSMINKNEQYISNIDSCSSWLTSTEDALDSAGDILSTINELVVEAANGTLNQEDREYVLVEIEELELELINVANTQLGDSYLFSGTATNIETYNEDGEYQGDYNTVTRQINTNTEIEISINGEDAFEDAFSVIQSIKDALKAGDTEELSGTLEGIEKAINTNNTFLSELGAKQNRIEFTETRLEDQNTNITEILSNNEDANMAEVITNYTTQQTIYNAALTVGANILQTSLVDFIS